MWYIDTLFYKHVVDCEFSLAAEMSPDRVQTLLECLNDPFEQNKMDAFTLLRSLPPEDLTLQVSFSCCLNTHHVGSKQRKGKYINWNLTLNKRGCHDVIAQIELIGSQETAGQGGSDCFLLVLSPQRSGGRVTKTI